MESITRMERKLANWYRGMPDLPHSGRVWLATNAWWVVLIGVILTVLALVVAIPLFFASIALTSTVSPYASYNSYYPAALGLAWVGLAVNIIGMIVTAVLYAMAVNPLKARSKKGWNYLYWAVLINLVLNVVGSIAVFSFVGAFAALLGAFISGYILFEVRDQFVGVKSKKVVKAKKA